MPLKYLSRGSQTNRGHLISVQGVFFSRYSWLIWLVVGRHTSQCVRSQEALSHLPSNTIYVDARIHHHYFCCFVDSGLEFSPWRIVSTTVQFSLGWASTKSANRFTFKRLSEIKFAIPEVNALSQALSISVRDTDGWAIIYLQSLKPLPPKLVH